MYKQISSNKRKSILLMIGFIFLYAVLGFVASLWVGEIAIFIAVGIAVVMVIVNLYMGDDLVVLVSGAHQITKKEQAPELWRIVENLAITAGLPMPRLFVTVDESPNAFAAGRNPKQAIVCCTTGLLEKLDEEELEGVIAHELSHVRNYDVRLMTWTAVLAGSIALLADIMLRMLWFSDSDSRGGIGGIIVIVAVVVSAILAPIAAILIQMAVSRKREYVADASGAELTRYPQGLASALKVIAADQEPSAKLSNNAIAHLMISPVMKGSGKTSTLFATHPSTDDRITRLMEMSGGIEHRHETQTEGRAYAGLQIDPNQPPGSDPATPPA